MKNNINFDYDLIIIGGGPAGLTAAIYAKRSNLNVAIFEKSAPGGKLVKTSEVENYPGFKKIDGWELAEKMHQQALALAVEFVYAEILDVSLEENQPNGKIIKTKTQTYRTKAVIIATGTIERKIGAKNETEYYGKGVSYCAVCDGPFYRDAVISVVGGGYSALEEALYLTKFAKTVNLIHRRTEFRADDVLVQKIKNHPQINLYLNYVVTEVLPTPDATSIQGVVLKSCLDDSTIILECKGLFPYIGSIPITWFVTNLGILNVEKYVIIDEKCQTSVPGIYACGDVATKNLRQIVTATSDGAIAAQEIIAYLDKYY